MKKITFILFALIAGTAFAQNSANGTADVKAEIVAPISLSVSGSLDFGKFARSASDATVIIDAEGTSRNFSETDMAIAGYTTFGVPTFTVTKDVDETYGVSLGVNTAPKTSGGATLTLGNLTHSLASDSGNTANSFSVGGEIDVPTTAAAGNYSGKVSVTVTYE